MKGTLKKVLALALASVMTIGLGAVAHAADLDTSEEVELTMYVVSDRPAGQDVVDENLNALLKEKLNCSLKVNWIGWAEYANKYPLLFSSGESFDLAYCATWLNFASLAQKGAFMSLDELWPTYAPKNFEAATESAKKQATIDGTMYCVPTLLATYNAYGPIYRQDLIEEAGIDPDMSTWEGMEEYLDAVKANHPEMDGYDVYSAQPEIIMTWMQSKGFNWIEKGLPFMFIDPTEENPKVFTYADYDGVKEALEMTARWNEKGFWSKSALADTDTTKTQNGKAAMRIHNIDTPAGYAAAPVDPSFEFRFQNVVKNVAHLPFTQDCMVISNTAKNPERAMAFWDLLTSDQEVYDAFYYGVLGETYTLNDEGQFQITDVNLYNTSAMWAARTTELNRNQVGTPDWYNEMRAGYEDQIAENDAAEKYTSFVFDQSSIETQVANVLNVQQQYWWPMELGFTDYNTAYDEYCKKMEAAGLQDIVDEAQRQLDEYVKTLE